jgi:hypothetical protein
MVGAPGTEVFGSRAQAGRVLLRVRVGRLVGRQKKKEVRVVFGEGGQNFQPVGTVELG